MIILLFNAKKQIRSLILALNKLIVINLKTKYE